MVNGDRTPWLVVTIHPAREAGRQGGGEGPRGKGREGLRKVDVRLPEKGDSNSHGARPVH